MVDYKRLSAPQKHVLYRLTLKLLQKDHPTPPIAVISFTPEEHCSGIRVWDLGLPCTLRSFIRNSNETWCFNDADEYLLLHATHQESGILLDMSKLSHVAIEYPTDFAEPMYHLGFILGKVLLPPPKRVGTYALPQGKLAPLSTDREIAAARNYLLDILRRIEVNMNAELCDSWLEEAKRICWTT
jgi:hypothetical protein